MIYKNNRIILEIKILYINKFLKGNHLLVTFLFKNKSEGNMKFMSNKNNISKYMGCG